jgi:hypothetical protein
VSPAQSDQYVKVAIAAVAVLSLFSNTRGGEAMYGAYCADLKNDARGLSAPLRLEDGTIWR